MPTCLRSFISKSTTVGMTRHGASLRCRTFQAGLALLMLLPGSLLAQANRRSGAVYISAGEFTPLYGVKSNDVKVHIDPFLIDQFPVTNAEFFSFVNRNQNWQREKATSLMSDRSYLKHWATGKGMAKPTKEQLKRPVTNVSWFSANDFCVWSGGRLPTVLEWEYIAAASETKKDASRDPDFVQNLLDWYSRPNSATALHEIGKGRPNWWGVHDLHGLIWEWTSDFNSVFVSGDNRRDSEQTKNLFCGSGAVSAVDKANYAAFMRYAFRSSLQGQYVTENLGFRCAYNSNTAKSAKPVKK